MESRDLALRSDQLQRDLGEGPCLSDVRDQALVLSNDLGHERRWARWADAVHREMGVSSTMSVQLYTGRRGHGALNLYATEP